MQPRKLIFLVIDGAADDPSYRPTPLEAAETPGLDELAKHAIAGLHYPIGRGVAPESDTAVLSLLGYEPEKYYTGRGPLEALGAGIRIREGYEVAFRGNFATVDERTLEIIDRRVGRSLTTEEARRLAEALDGMELSGGGYARVKATVGHRCVVVIGSREHRLSGMVSNTDPAYERRGLISVAVPNPPRRIAECKPLVDTPEARETCRLVNEFTRKAIEVLKDHPVNLERAKRGLLKANAVLLRDAGDRLPRLPPISERYGRSFAAVAEMPVEVGISVAAGMKAYRVPPPSGDIARDMPSRLEATLKALEENDAVYVHLKGPDEPGHDGDFERKVKAIELIDKHFIQPLLNKIDASEVAVLVTSDHATPWKLRTHSDGPVPFMVSWGGFSSSIDRFTEINAMERAEVKLEHGWQLLPYVMRRIGWSSGAQ